MLNYPGYKTGERRNHMSIDKEFEHLKEKIKAETEDALMRALKS